MRLYLEILLLKFLFYGFHRKDFDGLKFICGYLIMLCSIILFLIIYKTGYASKSLVWVWGVTHTIYKKHVYKERRETTHLKIGE